MIPQKLTHTDRPEKSRGFTLIELLVVISIIGLLSGMAAFNFQQARERARDVQRKSDLKQMQNALESYKNDQLAAHYPDTVDIEDLTPDYIKKIPVDPKERKTEGSWVEYGYTRDSVLEYDLVTCLENLGDLGRDEVNVCASGVSYTLSEP
jgi:prepilin-type N-terminal cleavage/methylation domain-containing protein